MIGSLAQSAAAHNELQPTSAGWGRPATLEAELIVYGCEQDEAALFRQMAPRFGVQVAVTAASLTERTAALALGKRCASIGHKTPVGERTLVALRQAGVMYLSTRSVGTNHVDMRCATRLGIRVETVPYSPDSVADYTLMLMLMALRHARSVVTRATVHDYRLSPARGRELRDMTVGVVGTGRIGRAVLRRLSGFGCRTLAHDSVPTADLSHVPLDALLACSDIVTLHTPLTNTTRHLLNRRTIELMKPGALIVNTARGGLIDNEALVPALESGRLGGAALDVVEGEQGIFYADRRDQPIEDALWLRLHALPNVLVSPHTAYHTDHALLDTVVNSVRNCLNFERELRRA